MKILGMAGTKRAGKDSSARYVMGHIMKKCDVIDRFDITPEGELLVNASYRDDDGKIVEGMGIFDTNRVDPEFTNYLQEMVWPNVKIYNFAESLKFIAMNIYGLEFNQLYGTSQEKESPTTIKWGSIYPLLPKQIRPAAVNKDEFMTAREFIQYFADILRWIDDDCLTKCLVQRIMVEQSPYTIIADVRRIKEVEAIHACGGKVIYHTRVSEDDSHHTEHEFDTVNKTEFFDAVIDNRACTIQEKNAQLHSILGDWNW